MLISRGNNRKDSKKKCKYSMGRSYSAPKPVWELLLVRKLQIILGETTTTPVAWFEPAASMTSPLLDARPRLPVDHLEIAHYYSINCQCKEFWNTALGERVRRFVWLSAIKRFRSITKEINHTKNWGRIYYTNIPFTLCSLFTRSRIHLLLLINKDL